MEITKRCVNISQRIKSYQLIKAFNNIKYDFRSPERVCCVFFYYIFFSPCLQKTKKKNYSVVNVR